MRILTVVNSLGKGGTERAAQNFAEAYSLLGHDSKVLALYFSGIRYNELISAGIMVWIGIEKEKLNEIAIWAPHIIHIHEGGIKYEIIKLIKEYNNNSLIVETNVFSIPSSFDKIVDLSFQLSIWCKYLYIIRKGIKEKAKVVPYPIKTQNFSRVSTNEILIYKKKLGIKMDHFVFGRIGQNYDSKWSNLLIEIFEEYYKLNPKINLILVNPPSTILKRILKLRKEISSKIVVIDEIIGDEELRICYSTIDIFLHIAQQGESFGMVLAESLLCQTPVITLSTPWGDNSQCEVIHNNIGGYVTTRKKYFIAAIQHLIDNPKLLKDFGEKGRNHIINEYDYIHVANLVITECLNNNSKPISTSSVEDIYKNVFGKYSFFVLKLLSRNSHTLLSRLIILLFSHNILHFGFKNRLMKFANFNFLTK